MMMMMKQLGFLLYCVTPGDLGPAEGSTGVYPGSHLVLAEVIDYHPPHTHPPPASHPPPPTHHPPPATQVIRRRALRGQHSAWEDLRMACKGAFGVVCRWWWWFASLFFPNIFTLPTGKPSHPLTINLFN